jgi:hypothetical protein
MARKKSTAGSTRPRTGDKSQQIIVDVIALARRLLDGTSGRRQQPAEQLVHELIDVALLALDESFVQRHLLAERGEYHSRGAIAASRFVRNGETALRKLLPGADPARIEQSLRLRLDEIFNGPDRKRIPQAAALEDLWQQRELAARMVHFVLAECGD